MPLMAGSESGPTKSVAGDGSREAMPHTIGDLIGLMWRRRYIAGSVAIAVAAVVLIITFRQTPQYQAIATFTVDRGEQAIDFQREMERSWVEYGYLNTERERILSKPVLRTAIQHGKLNDLLLLDDTYDKEAVVRGMLGVSTDRDSWVITVSALAFSPGDAERVLQAVVDAYLIEQQRAATKRARDAVTFLQSQIEDRQNQLQNARLAELAFRGEHGILSSDPEHNNHARRLRQLNDQWVLLEREMAASQALMDQVAAARLAPEPSDQTNALLRIEAINQHRVVNEQQTLLFELLAREVELAQKYGPKHPRMIEKREQIAAKRNHLSEAVTLASAAIEGAHREVDIQAVDLKQQIEDEAQLLADYRQALNGLRVREQSVSTQEDLLDILLRRQAEQEVTSRLEGAEVQVLDPAEASDVPINIRPKLFVVAALFLAMVSGVGSVLVLEFMDRRIRDADQVREITGLPILSQIPFISSLSQQGHQRGVMYDPPDELAEAYRHLRASLRLVNREGDWPRVLVCSSAQPGDGKTSCTAQLARALATAGARVLLVDADLRAPALHLLLDQSGPRGFGYLLVGEEDIDYKPTEIEGLTFLPAGELPPNPSELLHSACLPENIARWRKEYDFVMIDTPPLGLVADALTICEHVDGMVLVVRHASTMKALMARSLARLGPMAERLIGVVYNADPNSQSSYYAGYKYPYGAERKKGEESNWRATGQVSGWRTGGTISGQRGAVSQSVKDAIASQVSGDVKKSESDS